MVLNTNATKGGGAPVSGAYGVYVGSAVNSDIEISGGTITGEIWGNDGDDTIKVTGGLVTFFICGGNNGGNDTINISGGTITGNVVGGTGSDILNLSKAGTFSNTINTIETINKTGSTTTELTSTITGMTVLDVKAGTLDLNTASDLSAADTTISGGTLNIKQATALKSVNQTSGILNIHENLTVTNDIDLSGTMNVEASKAISATNLNVNAGSTLYVKEDYIASITGITNFAGTSKLQLNYKLATDKVSSLNTTGKVVFFSNAKIEIANAASMTENQAYTVLTSNTTLAYNDGGESNVTGADDLDSILDLSGNIVTFGASVIDSGGTFNALQLTVETIAGDTHTDNLRTGNSTAWNALNNASTSDYNRSTQQLKEAPDAPSLNSDVADFVNTSMSASPSMGGNGRARRVASLGNAPSGAAGPADSANGEIQTWMKVYGSQAEQNTHSTFTGYDSESYGVAIGAEMQMDDLTLGVALGQSDIDINGDAGSDFDIENYHLALYGGLELEDFFMEAAISYTMSDIDMQTTNVLSALNSTSDTDADIYAIYAGIGKNIDMSDSMTITPKLGLSYTHYEQDAYDEQGGFLRQFKSYDKDSLVSDLGATFAIQTSKD